MSRGANGAKPGGGAVTKRTAGATNQSSSSDADNQNNRNPVPSSSSSSDGLRYPRIVTGVILAVLLGYQLGTVAWFGYKQLTLGGDTASNAPGDNVINDTRSANNVNSDVSVTKKLDEAAVERATVKVADVVDAEKKGSAQVDQQAKDVVSAKKADGRGEKILETTNGSG
jgi:hypothetical protein